MSFRILVVNKILFQNLISMFPENVHTVPQVAFWNSEGEQGFLDWKCSEGMRGNAVWNSNGMGGKCVYV